MTTEAKAYLWSLTVATTILTATIIVLALLFGRPAHSQNYQPQCVPKLSQLAKRLGVPSSTQPGLLVAAGCDQRQYDILHLINALLDRLDKAERKSK